jgi:hypothetical protein
MLDWHRLFGLTLIDLFAGSPFEVELERDLSVRQQLLDVVIVRRRPGPVPEEMPDGLENLAEHNLLTYKSLREPLDAWSIDELVGHYVNYRKQSRQDAALLPVERFGLYGVSTRYPEKLAGEVALERERPGVHRATWGTHAVRVLVLSEMPEASRNAVWSLFSADPGKVARAAVGYQGHTGGISTVMNRLFERYRLEGFGMPYTMEDFLREEARRLLATLSPEEVTAIISPEELLRGLPVEERLRGLSPDEIRAYLEKLEQANSQRPD